MLKMHLVSKNKVKNKAELGLLPDTTNNTRLFFSFYFLVAPGQPAMPYVTSITRSSMTVVWEKPSVDGGSEIIGYCLEKRDKKCLRWQKVFKYPICAMTQKVQDLIEGKEYQYRICAINQAGEGPYSDVSDFYRAADPVGKD